MMGDLKGWIERVREQEEKRIGDVYAECEKRGCDRHFLSSFDTRIWLYPVEQAKGFLSLRSSKVTDQERLTDHLRQYRIFLEVLIEKRPNYEKRKEWEKALEVLKAEGETDHGKR